MASEESPRIPPARMQELQEQATASTNQYESIAKQAEARIKLIEDTRDVIADLKGKIKLANSLRMTFGEESKERKEALDLIQGYIKKLNDATLSLRKEDTNYRLVKIRLEGAFRLAKTHQHLLSQAQRKLVNSRLGVKKRVKIDERDWLPIRAPAAMVMPPQDLKTVQFVSQLPPEDREKFEELRRSLFYLFCFQYVENVDMEDRLDYTKAKQPLPNFRDKLLYSDSRIRMESTIASRVATNFAIAGECSFDAKSLMEARWVAIRQIEKEQMEAIGAEKEKRIRIGELNRRKSVHKWVEEQKKLSPLKPKLTTIINKNKSLAISCNPILTDYYENLKHKHLRNTNCKTFMKRILARPTMPNYADRILTIQLKDLLQNKNVQ